MQGLSYVAGIPGLSGRLRATPDDFVVQEEVGFAPSGSGEHVLLKVRKRAANTDWVARRIAAFAQVDARAVSYAGLKDRQAVAEQWFSVHLPGRPDPDWSACHDEEFKILEHGRHDRKLKRGTLRGNAFAITIRELRGDRAEWEERLQRLAVLGAPNYFGEQRFGLEGGNLDRAAALFAGRERVKDRRKKGLYLSAARAQLFNQVLSRRVADGSWNRPLAGDVMLLDGSHSVFPIDAVEQDSVERVAAMDIHPTGPLWGSGELMSRGNVAALECAVADELALFRQGLEQAGMRQERRALRVRVRDLVWEFHHDESVTVWFRLPAGAYATAVLREMVVSSEPFCAA